MNIMSQLLLNCAYMLTLANWLPSIYLLLLATIYVYITFNNVVLYSTILFYLFYILPTKNCRRCGEMQINHKTPPQRNECIVSHLHAINLSTVNMSNLPSVHQCCRVEAAKLPQANSEKR